MTMRNVRRALAILIMAAALLVGTSAVSDAGALCVRALLADPLDQVRVCANTNPTG